MNRSYLIEGIVIKRRNSGESDRLVTVYSPTHGKITLKAKGVRKSTRRSGQLE